MSRQALSQPALRKQQAVPVINLTIETTPQAVRRGLGAMFGQLAGCDLSQDALGTIEIVMAETLNNIVEHAFAGHDQLGQIAISATRDRNSLRFRITDLGAPMPGLALPVPKQFGRHNAHTELSEGGYGWGLIQLLCRDLAYLRSGGMNLLTFRLKLG